jgi:hypothetical protein
MVSLSFRPPSSRLRLPLGRLYDFPPFAGTRSRLRFSIILAFVLFCIALVFPFNGLFHGTSDNKIRLSLDGEVADFQREFRAEHEALGK